MSLMDEIKEEYGIMKGDGLGGVVTPPKERYHTSPYLHQVNRGYLSVIDHSEYNELSKHDYLQQQTVMTTFVFDVKQLIKFIDEGLYGYTESVVSSEELIRRVVINYPHTQYPSDLPQDPMLQSCYLALMSELAQKFVIVGIYNTIPEHSITPNGYLIVRVPAILTYRLNYGETPHG